MSKLNSVWSRKLDLVLDEAGGDAALELPVELPVELTAADCEDVVGGNEGCGGNCGSCSGTCDPDFCGNRDSSGNPVGGAVYGGSSYDAMGNYNGGYGASSGGEGGGGAP